MTEKEFTAKIEQLIQEMCPDNDDSTFIILIGVKADIGSKSDWEMVSNVDNYHEILMSLKLEGYSKIES